VNAQGYNIPGVRASGFKTAVKRPKVRGAKECGCGRRISANKIFCATCLREACK
jgi:hypothetical protein